MTQATPIQSEISRIETPTAKAPEADEGVFDALLAVVDRPAPTKAAERRDADLGRDEAEVESRSAEDRTKPQQGDADGGELAKPEGERALKTEAESSSKATTRPPGEGAFIPAGSAVASESTAPSAALELPAASAPDVAPSALHDGAPEMTLKTDSAAPRVMAATPVTATPVTSPTSAAATGAVDRSGLVEQIALQVRPGKSRISLRLDPPDLGRLALRLTLDRGRLVGEIAAESTKVERALAIELPRLERALSEQGVHVDSLELKEDGFRNFDGGDASSERDGSSTGDELSGTPELSEGEDVSHLVRSSALALSALDLIA